MLVMKLDVDGLFHLRNIKLFLFFLFFFFGFFFIAPMDKLIEVLNRQPLKNELDEAYINRLTKDIERVQCHIQQAEKAINSFDKDLAKSCSLEKRIIALYATYGNIPYIPDKNDTIATAVTSVILEEMIEEKRKEISQASEDDPSVEFDFTKNIEELKNQKQERLQEIKELSELIDKGFTLPLTSKWIESLELRKALFNYLKKVLIKYLAISDRTSGSVNNKDQVKETVRTLTSFFDSLLTSEWVRVPDNVGIIISILARDGVVIIKNEQAKLKGFYDI